MLDEEIYEAKLLWRIIPAFICTAIAAECLFLFKNPVGFTLTVVIYLAAGYLLFFRAPRVVIYSDGMLYFSTAWRLRTRKLNLLNLQSVDIKVRGKGYIFILKDNEGRSVGWTWGGVWNDELELYRTIDSAIQRSGANYLNYAENFLSKTLS